MLTLARTARAHAGKAAVAVFSTVGNHQKHCKTAPFSELKPFIPLDSSSLSKNTVFLPLLRMTARGGLLQNCAFDVMLYFPSRSPVCALVPQCCGHFIRPWRRALAFVLEDGAFGRSNVVLCLIGKTADSVKLFLFPTVQKRPAAQCSRSWEVNFYFDIFWNSPAFFMAGRMAR